MTVSPPTELPIIDLHSHWFAPSTREILGRRAAAPRLHVQDGRLLLERVGPGPAGGANFPIGAHWFDVDARIAHLDASGVAHQLISWPTTLGVDPALEPAESTQLWGAWNDDVAALTRAHPTRFSAVAALSTSDIAWSVKELARGHEKLGLIGGVLPVGAFFSPESVRQIAPILAAAQHYRSHIYLHTGFAHASITGQPPAVSHSDDSTVRWVIDSAWAFASAAATLAYTDALAPYPDITVQIAMLGGTGLAGLAAEQALAANVGRPVAEAFRQIWFDTGAAGSGSAAIASSLRVLGAERVVFGTDFAPKPEIPPVIQLVRDAVTGPDQADLVFSRNAQGLLARHGRLAFTSPLLTGELA